jgi:hypothetical protein
LSKIREAKIKLLYEKLAKTKYEKQKSKWIKQIVNYFEELGVIRSSYRRTSSDRQAWKWNKIYLNVPMCGIFDLLFYTLINPIRTEDLGDGKYFVNFEDICHFVFFTQHALKSRVFFENSFHLKQPMCLFDSIDYMFCPLTCLFLKHPVLPKTCLFYSRLC